jgi:hypothetical protein
LDAGVDAASLTTGAGNNTPVGIFVPSGDWYVSSPVFMDVDRVTLFGPPAGNAPPAQIVTPSTNFPPVMVGIKRIEPWGPGSPEFTAGYSKTFDTGHRFSLTGAAGWDGTQVGKYALTTRQPGSTMPAGAGDHWISWFGTPPAHGTFDHWGGPNSRTLTVSFAIKGNGASALGGGPLFGMGDTTSVGPQPWLFVLGNPGLDPAASGNTLVWFVFRTKEGGSSDIDNYRQCYINTPATTQTGWHHYTFHVDFTTNDGSGMCRLLGWVDGVQTTVLRDYGCRRTTPTGTPGLSNYEPSFVAADGLHFRENTFFSFSMGAQAQNQIQCAGINGVPQSPPGQNGIKDICFGGLRIDTGTCPYQTNLANGSTITLAAGGTPTHYQRYFDPNASASTLLFLMPLTDPPNDTSKNSNRLVSGYWNGHSGVNGQSGFGWFAFNENQNSSGNVVQATTLRDLTITTYFHSSAAILYGNAFHHQAFNLQVNGGWWGMAMLAGGYDYKIKNCSCVGDDAWIYAFDSMLEIDTMGRNNAGKTCLRLQSCNVIAKNIKTSDLNRANMITDVFIYFGGYGGYGSALDLDYIENDNEGAAFSGRACILVQRVVGVTGPTYFNLKNFISGNLGGNPVIILDDNGPVDNAHQSYYARADISNVVAADGTVIVQTNGPAWCGKGHDWTYADWTLGANSVVEFVKHTGAGGVGNFHFEGEVNALPSAGKWAKGTLLQIRNPAAGAVAEYICTTAGDYAGVAPVWKATKTWRLNLVGTPAGRCPWRGFRPSYQASPRHSKR